VRARSTERQAGDFDEMGFSPLGPSALPEGRLAIAILQRAVLDLITPGTPSHHVRSALAWLMRPRKGGEEGYVFSFEAVAELLVDDPENLRARIRRFVSEARRSGGAKINLLPRGKFYYRRGCASAVVRRGNGEG